MAQGQQQMLLQAGLAQQLQQAVKVSTIIISLILLVIQVKLRVVDKFFLYAALYLNINLCSLDSQIPVSTSLAGTGLPQTAAATTVQDLQAQLQQLQHQHQQNLQSAIQPLLFLQSAAAAGQLPANLQAQLQAQLLLQNQVNKINNLMRGTINNIL